MPYSMGCPAQVFDPQCWSHWSVHCCGMLAMAFSHIVLQLLADFDGLVAFSVRPRRALEAENLFLVVSLRHT